MNRIKPVLINVGGIVGFLVLVSCATPSHLQLTYRLPAEEKGPTGKQVSVVAQDFRKNQRILGQGAQFKFRTVSPGIALSIAKGTGAGSKKGIYRPSVLLKEAMESRLQHEGITVVPEGTSSFTIRLLLRSFLLDRLDYKWRVIVAYEARLIKDGKLLASEIISGEAERFELVGKEQAEVVLQDIFTDVVNRLDLDKLFRDVE